MTNESTRTNLYVERAAAQTYIARNERGAELRVGSSTIPDQFAPGELLQIALAACSILSADHTLASRLGDDFDARVDITSTKTDDGYRYDNVIVNLLADLSALEKDKRTALIDRAARAIDRLCTIGHTIKEPLDYTVKITSDPTI